MQNQKLSRWYLPWVWIKQKGKKKTTKKAYEIPERNILQIDKHDKEQTGPKCLQNNNICEKTKDKYESNSENRWSLLIIKTAAFQINLKAKWPMPRFQIDH